VALAVRRDIGFVDDGAGNAPIRAVYRDRLPAHGIRSGRSVRPDLRWPAALAENALRGVSHALSTELLSTEAAGCGQLGRKTGSFAVKRSSTLRVIRETLLS